MDLEDQLRNLFPDHKPENPDPAGDEETPPFWIPPHVVDCVYEKRKGKAVAVIRNYNGTAQDLSALASELKKLLHVGGGIKGEDIVIQGDVRDKIMDILKSHGFKVRRVGG